MMRDMETANGNTALKETCTFLSDYASVLLASGATCIRIQKNVDRMAEAFRVNCELTIMPANIQISIWDAGHNESYSLVKRKPKMPISFHVNTLLSKLSWDVADRRIGLDEARTRFREIQETPQENKWKVLVLASLANLSFCRLFNGDATAMLIVFIATMAGYRIKQILIECHADIRLVFFCSAFVSSVIGASAYLFHLGNTPDIAIGTSVLYLIPGIPYINSVSDLLDGHYICSFSRFIDALILTACLSLGLCGGMFLMGLKWLD